MARFGFCGGFYTSQSVNADAQRCMNLIPEILESDGSKSRMALYRTPGLKIFSNAVNDSPVRQLFAVNASRLFGVVGSTFAEFASDGTVKSSILGKLSMSGVAQICSSALELLVVVNGRAWEVNLSTLAVSEQTANLQGVPSGCAYLDGFFVVFFQNSNEFQISALNDATSWDALDVNQVEKFSDNIVSMIADHDELWFGSATKSIGYYNSGDVDTPIQPIPSAIIEDGCAAQNAVVRADNSIFWISRNERGQGIVNRAQGYVPQRISTHAIEYAWSQYSTINDAIAYSYVDSGHTFVVFFFPTANATWVYDAASGLWHERGFLTPQGTYIAHRSQCHAFCFGKHLVGDWSSGNIYEMNNNFNDDFGNPLRWMRRAPHISNEQTWMYHHQMQVDLEAGLGPEPPLLDGNGTPRDPQAILRWSDDGAHSWSNDHIENCGQGGKFKTRAIWRRLGRARDRVYELSGSDPIPWRIVDAYLDASPGFQPQERLATQLRKMA